VLWATKKRKERNCEEHGRSGIGEMEKKSQLIEIWICKKKKKESEKCDLTGKGVNSGNHGASVARHYFRVLRALGLHTAGGTRKEIKKLIN